MSFTVELAACGAKYLEDTVYAPQTLHGVREVGPTGHGQLQIDKGEFDVFVLCGDSFNVKTHSTQTRRENCNHAPAVLDLDPQANSSHYLLGERMADVDTTIADFFDTAKIPGKRGLRKSAKATLEMALMADGVPAGEVYDLLDTDAGVDRAFAKLDSIKAVKADIAWRYHRVELETIDRLPVFTERR